MLPPKLIEKLFSGLCATGLGFLIARSPKLSGLTFIGIADAHDLPVSHTTRRAGRPHTLVLVKTDAVFEREAAERKLWENELRWLTKTARAFLSRAGWRLLDATRESISLRDSCDERRASRPRA